MCQSGYICGSIFGLAQLFQFSYLGYGGHCAFSYHNCILKCIFFYDLYIQKIKIRAVKVTFRELIHEGFSMVNRIALYVTLLSPHWILIQFIFERVFLRFKWWDYCCRFSSNQVGGIVITAMSTDYYPRISSYK
jgi:hypothetical protein